MYRNPNRYTRITALTAAILPVVAAVITVVLVGIGIGIGFGVGIGAPAFAASAADPPTPAVHDLPTVINNMTVWITGILAAVATLFLTIGGARYLMAGGDPSEVERAKGSLKSAGIGYALALLAPVILTILKSILGG
ncbi:pilin [Virgisporangium aurantiacum]|uniref:Uncharacterized protein n=1 Tax=Virgisporangium aurantiacum TaxID=175570 RepID=A0A8J4DYZ7_9ACTN|nr:pilin [Virgisporangium aurantiacum]GIJ54988.1 hypothetical protein Vau01_025040 [Virgisporangium aurantiacum]